VIAEAVLRIHHRHRHVRKAVNRSRHRAAAGGVERPAEYGIASRILRPPAIRAKAPPVDRENVEGVALPPPLSVAPNGRVERTEVGVHDLTRAAVRHEVAARPERVRDVDDRAGRRRPPGKRARAEIAANDCQEEAEDGARPGPGAGGQEGRRARWPRETCRASRSDQRPP
jgi:hypothetical protein